MIFPVASIATSPIGMVTNHPEASCGLLASRVSQGPSDQRPRVFLCSTYEVSLNDDDDGIDWDVLRNHPQLALFLTLAAGYRLGRVCIGLFRLGPVVARLLSGVGWDRLLSSYRVSLAQHCSSYSCSPLVTKLGLSSSGALALARFRKWR